MSALNHSALLEKLFQPLQLARVRLPNRIIRSATYEGMADADGYPQPGLGTLYRRLTQREPASLITGFCAVSRQGRAMHPHQGAIGDDSYIPAWSRVVEEVKQQSPGSRLFMQLAHTGRQTRAEATGLPAVGASSRRCLYFRQRVLALDDASIKNVIRDFGEAAYRAAQSGFDGVQIHAAHGHLLHQFLSPHTNRRTDGWKDGGRLLAEVIGAVSERCGESFPILLKVSHADDRGLEAERVITALQPVAPRVDAVEVSYGTMEYALNIIRGDCPVAAVLKVNPLFCRFHPVVKNFWKYCVFPFMKARLKPFTPLYTLEGAVALKKALGVPVIPVGGVTSLEDMRICIEDYGFEAVSLCRAFIREPDLLAGLRGGTWKQTLCTHCNLCTIHCDSDRSLRCYHGGGRREYEHAYTKEI